MSHHRCLSGSAAAKSWIQKWEPTSGSPIPNTYILTATPNTCCPTKFLKDLGWVDYRINCPQKLLRKKILSVSSPKNILFIKLLCGTSWTRNLASLETVSYRFICFLHTNSVQFQQHYRDFIIYISYIFIYWINFVSKPFSGFIFISFFLVFYSVVFKTIMKDFSNLFRINLNTNANTQYSNWQHELPIPLWHKPWKSPSGNHLVTSSFPKI